MSKYLTQSMNRFTTNFGQLSILTSVVLFLQCPQHAESVLKPDPFFGRFSTKTKYDSVQINTGDPAKDEWFKAGDQCKAVHVSIVARHGSRNPGKEQVEAVEHIYNRMNKSFRWDSNEFPANNNRDLVESGREELRLLGRRTAIRLSSLFNQTTQLEYWTSKKQRTKDSAQEFNAGFTDVHPQFSKSPVYEESEDQLRFHAKCPKYQQFKNQKATLAEYELFESKQITRQEMDNVRQAVGLKFNISDAEIVSLYFMCGYETAIFNSSEWCRFLKDPGVIEVLEYLSDLKVYYQLGPANPITSKQSCPLVTAIFREMDKTIAAIKKGQSYVRGRFAFGHAETLGPLVSALGIFDDQPPLKAENFENEQFRTFRSSVFLLFAANVQLVLYECDSGFRLKLYINEEDVRFHFPDTLSGPFFCANDTRESKSVFMETSVHSPPHQAKSCPYEIVTNMLNDTGLIHCDFNSLCRISDAQTNSSSSVSSVWGKMITGIICLFSISSFLL